MIMEGPKAYPEKLELQEIWKYFSNTPLIHLATLDGDFPRVRMMALIEHNDKLWLASKSHWHKVAQIRKNANIEFTVPVRGEQQAGCIRATGRANIIEDEKVREELSKVIPWFDGYWNSPDDPNFTLISITLTSIKYDNPWDGLKYSLEL
jgi:general stress protein 26